MLFRVKQIFDFMPKTTLGLFVVLAANCILFGQAMAQLNIRQPLEQDTAQFAGHTNRFPVCGRLEVVHGSHISPVHCIVGIDGWTNLTLFKPLKAQSFEAHLYDENSKEVSKAFFGKPFGSKIEPDKKLIDGSWQNDLAAMYGNSREMCFTNGFGTTLESDLDIVKSFRIKGPGEYRLQVEVRLFNKDTNGIFQPFILPPVESKVSISDSDLAK